MERRYSDNDQDDNECVKSYTSSSSSEEEWESDDNERAYSHSSSSDSDVDVNEELQSAIKQDDAAAVARWLERGANVHGVGDEEDDWPMFVASQHNSTQAMRVLLQYGADKDQRGINDNFTPLIGACFHDEGMDVVQLLLDVGCNVNLSDESGETALMKACARNSDVVKLLLSHGAKVNAEDDFKCTPFFFACSESKVDVMQLLVEHGADIHHKDEDGGTALFHALWRGAPDAIRWLLEHGLDVSDVNKRNQTPLFSACRRGSIEAVEALLELGADVDHEDDELNTPLHYVYTGKKAELLIQYGADVYHTNRKGSSVALSLLSYGYFLALDVVLRHGRKIVDNDGAISNALVKRIQYKDNRRALDVVSRVAAPRVLKWYRGAWVNLAANRWNINIRRTLFAAMLAGRIG